MNPDHCHASVVYTTHEDSTPPELVQSKKLVFEKLRKEVPEMAEFLDGMVGPVWSISTFCTLPADHDTPHAFILRWYDPTRERI